MHLIAHGDLWVWQLLAHLGIDMQELYTAAVDPLTLNCARNSMQWAWPSRLRLKQPSRSPDSESAPQHITIAVGWKTSITWRDCMYACHPEHMSS